MVSIACVRDCTEVESEEFNISPSTLDIQLMTSETSLLRQSTALECTIELKTTRNQTYTYI